MKNLYILILGAFLISSCQPFSFKPLPDKDNCLEYMAEPDGNIIGFFPPLEHLKAYLLPRFHPESEREILFVHRGNEPNWKIMQLNLDTHESSCLQESEVEILSFDLNPDGRLVYLSWNGLFLHDAQGIPQRIPTREPFVKVKWIGEDLLVMNSELQVIDTTGNLLTTFTPHRLGLEFPHRVAWNTRGDQLATELRGRRADFIYVFQYGDVGFQVKDSVEITDYTSVEELGRQMSGNRLSIDLLAENEITFSRSNIIYHADLESGRVVLIWQREDCLITESEVSLSPSGQSLVAGASYLTRIPWNSPNGRGKKKMGLLLLEDDFSRESADFP